MSLSRSALRWALPRMLAKTCPDSIPRTGEAGAMVDCFSVRVVGPDGVPNVLLRSINGSLAHGFAWDGLRYNIPTSVDISQVDPSSLQVERFSGTDTIYYDGAVSVLQGEILRLPYLRLRLANWHSGFTQFFFNKRRLRDISRVVLLKAVFDLTSGGEWISAMDVMTARYGHRWAGHQGWRRHHRLIEAGLDRLASAGELEGRQGRYRANGQTQIILDQSSAEERRLRFTRISIGVAIIGAIIGAVIHLAK